ncbi:unnamed protein product [Plutella xylostella]|uniref:(diamondback moth) hypothetical protein n=1 Tax=Plutella xylostella TaxID=51655 RepID=A0A8S4GAB1_PLUXY|nr:unnamed protein product [Plutella xylostella]
MNRLRPIWSTFIRAQPIIGKNLKFSNTPVLKQQNQCCEPPPAPFENMPFSMPNRYMATLVFSLFFGIGLWAPFLIVWYMMAKRTL